MPSSSTIEPKSPRDAALAAREPAAVEQVLAHAEMREQAAVLEDVADAAAMALARTRPRSVSTSVSPSMTMRPRCGRIRPATMSTRRRLARARAAEQRRHAGLRRRSARRGGSCRARCSTSTSRLMSPRAGRRCGAPAARSRAGRSIEIAIETSGQPQRAGVAARHLGEGVDRRRQGLGLAGDVGDEGDGGAELAHRLGEGQDRAGDDARQASAAG